VSLQRLLRTAFRPSWVLTLTMSGLFDVWYTQADSTDPAKQNSAFRFWKAPLNRVYPWCQAHSGHCVPNP
jgi:hypothetical protein